MCKSFFYIYLDTIKFRVTMYKEFEQTGNSRQNLNKTQNPFKIRNKENLRYEERCRIINQISIFYMI